MKTRAVIASLLDSCLGGELFAELERIHPEGRVGYPPGVIWINLPATDARYQQITDKLASGGFHPCHRMKEADFKTEYRLNLKREYDRADYDAATYLEVAPTVFIYEVGIPEDEYCPSSVTAQSLTLVRPIPLLARNLAPDIDFAYSRDRHIRGGWIVVPDRVRRLIESAGLIGPVFKPTVLVDAVNPTGNVIPWERFGEPWWELQSSITLPPVSPTMELYDGRSNRIERGNTEVGAVRMEGHYTPVELHYLSSEMAKAPPFDLACTREAFFAHRAKSFPEDSALVASKRFSQFCVDNNLKTNWVPVRIDGE